MLNLHTRSPVLQPPCTPLSMFSRDTNRFPPFSTVGLHFQSFSAQPGQLRTSVFVAKAGRSLRLKTQEASDGEEDKDGGFVDIDFEVAAESEDGFPGRTGFGGREEEKDFDRDPEFAEIMGACLDDPEKARSKMEDRLRKKRNKILQTKSGSGLPMNVTFNNNILDLACLQTIRSWHIIGRMGGCNSMNMQLSQSPFDKRPSYDAIQGANVTPTTFYNIGDLEVQDNLARVCFVGIKQVVFGGSEFENWKENMTSEDAGYSIHNI
ncbi:hypothetical protein DVH24_029407 [Malus domestica]|uniref:Uncharacterized protein n=1 Tax=Malus domestica TaxID=3750 RepID=A0A498HTB9_MALDO|nr:hypothetical protein DVH24_029407 [Malus domestica]